MSAETSASAEEDGAGVKLPLLVHLIAMRSRLL